MTTIEVMQATLEDLNREVEELQRSRRAIERMRQSRNSSHWRNGSCTRYDAA